MAWTQLVAPDLTTTDTPGSCLEFTQRVFNAPAQHNSAYEAEQAVQFLHTEREMPPVAVPVFFTWTGTVNGITQDWGHIVVWVPERNAFLSSPLTWAAGDSQQWVNTLEDFTSILGPTCTYLGWSEDLNTLQIVSQTIESKEDSMFAKVNLDSGDAYLWNLVSGVTVHIDQMPDYQQIDANFKTFKFSSQAEFENFRARFAPVFPLPTVDPAVLTTAVADSIGGIAFNVEALSAAIASILGAPAGPVTKAEVLSAIQTHYTEAK